VLAVQSTLTATVGDSFAFVESPIRAALIRECILDGLKRLKPLCVHTVVVAHSQGAAVVLEALGALEPSNEKREVAAAWRLVPDALITLWCGYEPTRKPESPGGQNAKDGDKPGPRRGRGYFRGGRVISLAVLERNGRAHSMGR